MHVVVLSVAKVCFTCQPVCLCTANSMRQAESLRTFSGFHGRLHLAAGPCVRVPFAHTTSGEDSKLCRRTLSVSDGKSHI